MSEVWNWNYLASLEGAVATKFKALLESSVTPEMHGATGVFSDEVDDTAHLQWALDTGKPVFLPPGNTYRVTDGLLVQTAKQRIWGGGTSIFTAGIAEKAGLLVTADNVVIEGIELINLNELQSSVGERNYAVSVEANAPTVRGVTTRLWQNGIAHRAEGTGSLANKELIQPLVEGCRIYDIVGAGLENRGDGVTFWSACGIMRGNIVTAKPGTDARCAFHGEGLTLSHDGTVQYADSFISIIGCQGYGPFRRGAVLENITGGTIADTTVAGMTWWGMALILGKNCTISNPTVRLDVTAADLPEGYYDSWDVKPGGIVVRQASVGHSVSGGNVNIHGEAQFGLKAHSEPGSIPIGATFDGVHVTAEDGSSVDYGFLSGGDSGATAASVHACHFIGEFNISPCYDNEGVNNSYMGNHIFGLGSDVPGIHIPANATGAIVASNVLHDVGTILDEGSGSTIGTNYTR